MNGSDLRSWRTGHGKTLEQAANILGRSRSSLSNYERGYRYLSNGSKTPCSVPEEIIETCKAYDRGIGTPTSKDSADAKSRIIQVYLDHVKSTGLRPKRTDFNGPDAAAIRYHFGSMDDFHDAMDEELDLSEYLFEAHDIFTPERLGAFEEALSSYDKFIVTTAVSSKAPFEPFVDALRNYCERENAAIIVILCKDTASTKRNSGIQAHPSLNASDIHILQEEAKINNSIFISDIKMSAKQIQPLTGLKRIAQYYRSSVIYGSPKQSLDFVAISADHEKHPFALMSTGAITIADYDSDLYMSQRTSYIAERDHIFGAIVVERDGDDKFHFRQIQAERDGSFIDLGSVYSADGSVHDVDCVLVMGDYHAGATDPIVRHLVGEICEDVNVVDIVIHDFFDGYAISHHDREIPGKMARKSEMSLHVLEEELRMGSEELWYLQSHISGNLIMVKSNHDEFLDRYLNSGAFIKDHVNYKVAIDLHSHALDFDNPMDILDYAYRKYGTAGTYDPDRIIWLQRDESYMVGDIELGAHGDLGPNGSRGSLKNLEDAHGACVVGHTHSAAILRSVFRVGTSSKLSLDYNRGPSSWTHTHCLVYPSGARQLINIVDGSWRLK